MSSYHSASEAEHRVIEQARRVLGANLSSFLLAGLGEPLHLSARDFTAKCTEGGEEISYRLRIATHSDLGLPAGKDPLVLAAVLSIISAGGGYADEVVLNTSLIIETLGWTASQNSLLTIEQALERYSAAQYYMSQAGTGESDPREEGYSHYRRLLAGYDIDYERPTAPPDTEAMSITVKFLPGFLPGVSTEHKFFFGIDFERLHGMQEAAFTVLRRCSVEI